MTTIRSRSGISAARAFSSVVLPVPVPPEIEDVLLRRRPRPRAAPPASGDHASRLRPDRPGCTGGVNLRIVRTGPATAHGGNIAATRDPSSSRASSIGCISEISSPQARAMFLIATVRFRVSSVRSGTDFERAVALDKHAAGPRR